MCQETSRNGYVSSLTKARHNSPISRHEAGSKLSLLCSSYPSRQHTPPLKFESVKKLFMLCFMENPNRKLGWSHMMIPLFQAQPQTMRGDPVLGATTGASTAASCRSSPSPGGSWPPRSSLGRRQGSRGQREFRHGDFLVTS